MAELSAASGEHRRACTQLCSMRGVASRRSAMHELLEFRQKFQDRQILDIVPISERKEFHRAYTLRVSSP
jgi:hypothetical protein